MKKKKGSAALVLIVLAMDVGYILLKGTKTILRGTKRNESNDAYAVKGNDSNIQQGAYSITIAEKTSDFECAEK